MKPINHTALNVVAIFGVGAALCTAWQPLLAPGPAQAAARPPRSAHGGEWVRLSDYTVAPPYPVWVNLDRADTIRFYSGSYGTQQNVPQATIYIGTDIIQVNAPAEIALLRRYVQSHQPG